MIEVKSFFTDWHEVDKETAKRFVKHILQGATAMPFRKRIEYVEEKKLRGLSVKELFKGDDFYEIIKRETN